MKEIAPISIGWTLSLLLAGCLTSSMAGLSEQAVTVSTAGKMLHVKAPGFTFIQGPVLDRLRDGRSVRVDMELRVLARQGGTPVAQSRQSFTLSFDLWEERFAVTRAGTPPRSISHLTSRHAEAWCLDNLTVPLDQLGPLGRDTPLWIALEYRVHHLAPEPRREGESPSALGTLIDLLSRRQQDNEPGHVIEAGPFRLAD